MKNNSLKSLTVILAAALFLGGAGIVLSNPIEDAYASTSQTHVLNNDVYNYDANNLYTRTITLTGPGGSPDINSVEINGTVYDRNSDVWEISNQDGRDLTISLDLPSPAVTGNPYAEIVVTAFLHNTGYENIFKWITKYIRSTAEYTVTAGDQAIPNFDPRFYGSEIIEGDNIPGISFVVRQGGNVSIVPEGTFTAAGKYIVLTNFGHQVTINVDAPLLDIPYVEPSNAIVDSNWVYKPTTTSGVLVTVDGPNWLSANNGTVYGIPPTAGDYDVSITMKKAGYADKTESFTLTVANQLTLISGPLNGVIFYVG